jgi:hypothetical protein
MPKSEPVPPEVPYLNDFNVRESFADTTRFVSFNGQMVHAEFTVMRQELVAKDQSKAVAVPTARLVLTPFAALALRDQLSVILANMEKTGALRRVEPPASLKQ